MKLEICANSYQSAKNAQDAEAHRVELCQELSVGGITPSYGLIQKVARELDIPVFVLIRPRGGNFVYTDDEFEIMKKDIELCKELGCHGIVSGVLNPEGTIDLKRTKALIELSQPLPFTFHRAFDEIEDSEKAIEQLIDLGANRVLTSGKRQTAMEGIELLKALKMLVENRITIMPGSGINRTNASAFKKAGFEEIHASASKVILQDGSLFFQPQTVSDVAKIKAILNEI
ncbi:copper homeostasis protein CutC [Winogradskyella tangerina]|uniref:copper homeostasis protein CutC n=1 Tax=Winogradskyella tangerina TaxID=2023240 RepID=UPI000DBE8E67|nr:copper homeostasis protein CutC [Winogradskyella tangerina]